MSNVKYFMKVDVATSADEMVIEVPGLGAVKNGTIVEVSEELAEQFKNMQGVDLAEANLPAGFEVIEASQVPQQRKGKKTEQKGDS